MGAFGCRCTKAYECKSAPWTQISDSNTAQPALDGTKSNNSWARITAVTAGYSDQTNPCSNGGLLRSDQSALTAVVRVTQLLFCFSWADG